jgi:hypothetical protein
VRPIAPEPGVADAARKDEVVGEVPEAEPRSDRAQGRMAARRQDNAAVPPYEMPTAATRPSDQGRETIQSSTAKASPASGGHSSGRAPNDAPAPRTSMSTTE